MHANPFHGWFVSELVRCALALSATELAEQLVGSVKLHTPLSENAIAACRAQPAEAAADHAEAAGLYADAAERWHEFGNVPERAYALLGHGRALLALGDSSAELQHAEARDLFRSLGYRPALAQTEGLLAQNASAAR